MDPSLLSWKTAKSLAFSNLPLFLILACVMLAPQAFGAIHFWPVTVVTCLCLIALCLHVGYRIQDQKPIRISWVGLPFFLATIFTLVSPSLDPPQTALRAMELIAACCIFIIIADRAQNRKVLQWILWSFMVGGLLLVVVAVLHRILRIDHVWGLIQGLDIPLYAPVINPNHLSKYFAVFSLMSIAGFLSVKNLYIKYLFGTVGAMCGMCVPLATSKGGTIVFALALLAIAFMRMTKWTFIILAWSVLASLYIAQQAIFDEMSGLSQEYSVTSKTSVYQLAPYILKHHGLVGTGSGSTDVDYLAHTPSTTSLPEGVTTNNRFLYFENILIQTLVDHGLLKGILLIILSIFAMWQIVRQGLYPPVTQIAVVSIMLLIAGDVVDFTLESGAGLWLIAMLMGICAAYLPSANSCCFSTRQMTLATSLLTFSALWSSTSAFYNSTNLDKDPIALRGLEKHPHDAFYPIVLANEAREKRDFKQALKWSKLALKLEPVRAEAHIELARAYIGLNQGSLALTEYRRAIELHPLYAADLVHEVASHFRAQETRAQVLPDFSAAYFNLLCTELAQEDRIAEAQSCYRVIGQLPDATRYQLLRAAEYELTHHEISSAVSILKRLTGSRSPDGEAASLQARILERQTNTQTAFEHSNFWLAHAKHPCSLLTWRVSAAASLRDFDSANRELERLRTCPGEEVSALEVDRIQANLFRQMDEPAKALQIFTSLSQTSPDDPGLLHTKFDLEMQIGQIDAAAQSLQEIRRLAPNDDLLSKMSERIAQAKKERENEYLNNLDRSRIK